MPYNMVVLMKQVPDTKNITGEAMKPDGTVNRSSLPYITNPDDLNALELALEIKDRHGGRVSALCMGPPTASDVLREALFRGADDVALISDIRFANADTLATSYTLAAAIRKIGAFDLVICGHQAIDGDTAQVGPQTAEKLGIPQVTYLEELITLGEGKLRARRRIDGGYEVTECPLPALVTVMGGANDPRPPDARRLMKYKRYRTILDIRRGVASELASSQDRDKAEALVQQRMREIDERGWMLPCWTVEDLQVEPDRIGLAGSATRVKETESVKLKGTDIKHVDPTEEGLAAMVHELITDHTLE